MMSVKVSTYTLTAGVRIGDGKEFYMTYPCMASISLYNGTSFLANVISFKGDYLIAVPFSMIGSSGFLYVSYCDVRDFHVLESILNYNTPDPYSPFVVVPSENNNNINMNEKIMSCLFEDLTDESVAAVRRHNDFEHFKKEGYDCFRVQLYLGDNITGSLEWKGPNLLIRNSVLGDILVHGDDIALIYPMSSCYSFSTRPAKWHYQGSAHSVYHYKLEIDKNEDVSRFMYLKIMTVTGEIKTYVWDTMDSFMEDWYNSKHFTQGDKHARVLDMNVMGLAICEDCEFADVLNYVRKIPGWK